MRDTTKKTLEILDKFPATRWDDNLLIAKVLQGYCNNKAESDIIETIIKRCPNNLAWFVRRRAIIQNGLWLYKPNQDVLDKREKHNQECKTMYWIDYKKEWFFGRLKRLFIK